jgi:murein DD-endopeptidase MepM/ murein hydrolase activator NlpD
MAFLISRAASLHVALKAGAAVTVLASAAAISFPVVRGPALPQAGPAAVVDVRDPTAAEPPSPSPRAPVLEHPGSRAPALGQHPAYSWPLDPVPVVVRAFALGPMPWSAGHRGVDLQATAGQPALAAGAGVIAFAGVVAGRGVVVVQHGESLRTTYEPVEATVRAGSSVNRGQPLGTVEDRASHCSGACLHWGALRAGQYIDPLSLLRPRRRPILLPVTERASAHLGELGSQLQDGLGVHLADAGFGHPEHAPGTAGTSSPPPRTP